MDKPLIPAMPYVPALTAWLDHKDGCMQCATANALGVAGLGLVMLIDLCDPGAELNEAVQTAIHDQYHISKLN